MTPTGKESPPMDVRANDGKPSQYLSFFIDGEEYAIGILQVKEIIRWGAITKVPTTPRWIRGVLNLRGLVVPVVDLAAKLGIRETPVTAQTCVGEPPPFGTRVRVDYIVGMGKAGKKFVHILDIDGVLSADELMSVAEAARDGEAAGPEAARKEIA